MTLYACAITVAIWQVRENINSRHIGFFASIRIGMWTFYEGNLEA